MATIDYTFVSRCAGGGHTTLDVSVNGGPAKRVTFDTDTLRSPLADLSADEREDFAEKVLRVHCAGKTRAQLAAEFQTSVTVTI